MWTLENLLRLAHSAACRELSDLARLSARTCADRYAHGGDLVEEAERLVAAAEDVRLLAVAVERQRGTSWETIGECLAGRVSKQAAQGRFGDRVDELVVDVLLPLREGRPGGLGWTAGPDGIADPDRSLAWLDEWAARHHERTDGGGDHVDELVSHGLRERLRDSDGRSREAIGRIGTVTLLAQLIMDSTGMFAERELPQGVTEAYARRRLLEEKVALYDAMRREAKSPQAFADAVDASTQAWDELVDWHRAAVRERLGHVRADDIVFITLDGRPVRALARTDAPADDETRGWWLWGVGDQSSTTPRPEPQLPERLWHAASRMLGIDGGDFLAAVDVSEHAAIAAALDNVCDHIASDWAKGFRPFGPGGIAGPPAATGDVV